MGNQYGFYIRADRCVQCHACELACGSIREVEQGLRWRKVMDVWSGEFPKISNRSLSFACAHCMRPACMEACPEGAISKRSDDGIVVVDTEKCIGCRTCGSACPFGVPRYGKDKIMQKCDMCLGWKERGTSPACVETCPGEALSFGALDDLIEVSASRSAFRLAASTDPSILISGNWTSAEVMKLFESYR